MDFFSRRMDVGANASFNSASSYPECPSLSEHHSGTRAQIQTSSLKPASISISIAGAYSPMAALDLPCDGDGVCMRCSTKTPEAEVVHCQTCTTPWHVQCLSKPPETMAAVVGWLCPDCVPPVDVAGAGGAGSVYAPSTASSQLVAAIRAIEGDASLTEAEKAKRRQKLLSGGVEMDEDDDEEEEEEEEEGEEGRKRRTRKGKGKEKEDAIELFDGKFKCSFCMQLPERPVTVSIGFSAILLIFLR